MPMPNRLLDMRDEENGSLRVMVVMENFLVWYEEFNEYHPLVVAGDVIIFTTRRVLQRLNQEVFIVPLLVPVPVIFIVLGLVVRGLFYI